jgi:branched-chain amino acid aminotransferase
MGGYLRPGLRRAHDQLAAISDEAIPACAKVSGAYINTALAVDEAAEHGAEEAIFPTSAPRSEGGGSNLFMVRDGELITPPVTDDILKASPARRP